MTNPVYSETTYSFSREAPAAPERRQQRRHLTILRVGTIISGDHRELCLLRNISAGGAMLHIYSHYNEGQPVAVEVRGDQPIPGHVAWVSESNIGVAFDEPIDVTEMLSAHTSEDGQQQRLPRVEVDRLAMLRVGSHAYGVNTRDISQGGVKLEIDEGVGVGTEAVLEFDRFRPLKGTIRWCHDGMCGLAFNETIPFAELMAWLRDG